MQLAGVVPLRWRPHQGLRAGPEPGLFCFPCGPFSPPLCLPPRCQVRLWRRQVCVNLALRVSVHPGCSESLCIYLPGSDSRDVFPAAGCPGPGASTVGCGKAGLSPRSEALSLHHGRAPCSYKPSEPTRRVWQAPLTVTGCSVLSFGALRGRGRPALGMKGSGKGSVQEGPSPKCRRSREPGKLHEVQTETQI